MTVAAEVIAARHMNALHVWLDLAFLVFFVLVLVGTKRYQALLAGLAGAVVYFGVDYGVFYLILGTRVVEGASPFWFLLWLSLSYGLTNVAWIWLWLDRDRRALEWSLLIVCGWLAVALLGTSFGAHTASISIARGTAHYHGVMALLLFAGYAYLCVRNIQAKEAADRAPLLWILAIGILVQFSWEAILALTGIRNQSLQTLVVNSLLETNMGLPYFYLIHRAVTRRWDERLRPRSSPPSPP
jgi:hypothetical protein